MSVSRRDLLAIIAMAAAKPALGIDTGLEQTVMGPYQLANQIIHGRQSSSDTFLNGVRVLGANPSGSQDKWGGELQVFFDCHDTATLIAYSERASNRSDKSQRAGKPLVTHLQTFPNMTQWVRDEKSLSPSYIVDSSGSPDALTMYFRNPGAEANRERQVYLNNLKRGTAGFRDRQYFQPGTVGLTSDHAQFTYSPQNISDNQTLSRLLMVDGGSHPIVAVLPMGLASSTYAQSYQNLLIFGYRTESGPDMNGRIQDGQGEARLVLAGMLQIPANPDDNNTKFTRIEQLTETAPNRSGDFNEYNIYVGGMNRETGEPNWAYKLNNYPREHPSAATETVIPWSSAVRIAANMDDKYGPRILPQ